MERFLNALKAQSQAQDQAYAHPRFGTLQSFDPKTYTARVQIQPDNVLSGWLPILTLWGGNGWGLAAPPTPGQQVLLVCQEGEAEHGVILGTAFSTTTQPPAAPSGEFWLVHQTGSFLKLLSDGSIQLKGNVTITGNLTVSGDIADASGAHGTLAALRQAYDGHTHTDDGGTTSTPSQTV